MLRKRKLSLPCKLKSDRETHCVPFNPKNMRRVHFYFGYISNNRKHNQKHQPKWGAPFHLKRTRSTRKHDEAALFIEVYGKRTTKSKHNQHFSHFYRDKMVKRLFACRNDDGRDKHSARQSPQKSHRERANVHTYSQQHAHTCQGWAEIVFTEKCNLNIWINEQSEWAWREWRVRVLRCI